MYCDGCKKDKHMVFPCPECPKHHCEECLQGDTGLYCPDCRKNNQANDVIVEEDDS